MKRLALLILVFSLAVSTAYATEFDLSGLSLEELLALKQQVTMAMWETDEWQEVEVPVGIYEVGVDIPAGYWTIRTARQSSSYVAWGDALDKGKASVSPLESSFFEGERILSPESDRYKPDYDVTEVSWQLIEGTFVEIRDRPVVFTPFQGHDLGFK